ncbi:MAG: protein-L-isoaspartate O-methyltransferase [Rickettsiales bacterium]|nr:protein-L-isoaspartate O-methyltransferase [Rickettsiales bacterium]|tara:strand:- start:4946 stop:5599 length:654 start_codon:yes stop_codon:yes gene_type:complete
MDFDVARLNMVESQLKPNFLTDKKLIDIFRSIKRENFVKDRLKARAYADENLEIAANRFMLEPVIFARMVQAAELKSSDIVLDIGCGTGYSTAVFSQIVEMVIGLEQNEKLAEDAEENLKDEAFCNTAIYKKDHNKGLKDQGPFDVIFINGVVDEIPETLIDQLKEGGRLLAIEKNEKEITQAVLVKKIRSSISKKSLFDAFAHYLVGFEPEQKFTF